MPWLVSYSAVRQEQAGELPRCIRGQSLQSRVLGSCQEGGARLPLQLSETPEQAAEAMRVEGAHAVRAALLDRSQKGTACMYSAQCSEAPGALWPSRLAAAKEYTS